MCAVCLIRVETQGPDTVLLSVLTTHDLSGGKVDRWLVSNPEDVLPLVQSFLDRSIETP